MEPLTLLLDSARASIPLLRHPATGHQWSRASALTGWSVAGLTGHFARSLFNLERAAQVSPPPDAGLLDAVDYYTLNEPLPANSDVGRRIRALGDEEAAHGPEVLISRFVDSLDRLDEQHTRADFPPTVTLFGSPMSLGGCATACLLELVVHADDLAISIDASFPDFNAEALDLVVGTLAQIALRRRGTLRVLRAFSRAERTQGSIAVF